MRPISNHAAANFQISHLLLLISLLLVTGVSHAEDTSEQARKLINATSKASRELNYDATFVYRKDNMMDVMQLIHKNDNGIEAERLVSLSGQAREIIRDDESVTCIFPEDQAVMVEKSRPRKFLSGQLPEPIEKIADYYSFEIAGIGRILDRDTWIVNIVPRDDYRYGYQLWIDKSSHLSLKTELKTKTGRSLEQILFTRLSVMDQMPDSMLKPSLSGSGFTWYNHGYNNEVESDNGQMYWQVGWMPGGFTMSEHEKQPIAASDQPVDHLVYSDGLATVSVFVEKIKDKPVVQLGATQMGGVNAFATLTKGYQVTAVGEVPLTTVEQMAKSVTHR
ncbi:MAG: MucB/RseB C-terminal domain-containing protein [Thiotrichales bacterium]|nr:MucB/RseB C-terminal domain-containing protein [Thiotrichales bacterium]